MGVVGQVEMDQARSHRVGLFTRGPWIVVAAYLAAAFGTAFLVVAWIHPWTMGPAQLDGVFSAGGDMAWNQAVVQAHAQSGVFGATAHLAWPTGFDPWSQPVYGFGIALGSWLTAGLLGLSIVLSLWVIVAVAAAASAAATLFFLRGVVASRFTAVTVAVSIAAGASTFVLSKSQHPNVGPTFFLVPLALGAALRWSASDRRRRSLLVMALVTAAVMSPLWWVVVSMALIGVMTLPQVLRRRWRQGLALASVFAAVTCGLAFQWALFRLAAAPDQPATRNAWDSNIFGGHLVDLLLASPWLNSAVGRIGALSAGGSIETSAVGLAGGVAAIAALVMLLAGLPRRLKGRVDTGMLADATIATTLLFVLGGLGNLIAAAAVLAGTTSPARTWARLTIVLALLGAAWLLAIAAAWLPEQRSSGTSATAKVLAVTVCSVLALSWIVDARATHKDLPVPKNTLPEFASVSFITASLNPCPVAQLPQEEMPNSRLPVQEPTDIDNFVYRGYYPYLIAPDFFWSYASAVPGRRGGLNDMPVALRPPDLTMLAGQGYCALLYDRQLADAARERGISLEGRDRGDLPTPDFSSDRYDVYLLTAPRSDGATG